MVQLSQSNVSAGDVPVSASVCEQPALSSLLADVEDHALCRQQERQQQEFTYQNQLVQVRLGLASSLFTALRAKHAPTAAHSLRVALICSAWAEMLELDSEHRDALEVAALLHDIGKIGVPDCVLLKPSRLTEEEITVLNRRHDYAREILGACCASEAVLQIIHYSAAWYDGSRLEYDRSGNELPIGARMLAVADAYDAMTSDCVFRQGYSRQRAMAELIEHSETQFDPTVVRLFSRLLAADQNRINARMASRWLRQLKTASGSEFWRLHDTKPVHEHAVIDGLFHRHLLENMKDAVILVDADFNLLRWNRAAENLTGRAPSKVIDTKWYPGLIELRDENYKLVTEEKCPVTEAIRTGATFTRRYHVTNGKGEKVSVTAVISPINGSDGVTYGVTVMLRDASSEVVLQERVETLHAKATTDPLTGIANRAEFDRALREFVESHSRRNCPFSLIITDLDYFKKINDRFGHQAGDEALIAFASLLEKHRQPDDVVARYGGEEFVMLCANCDNAEAAMRAEQVRLALAAKPQPMMGGKCITASFGVTELQAGDTAETVLRRADRALLQAKDDGRNKVVHLGLGLSGEAHSGNRQRRRWCFWQSRRPANDQLLERQLITAVPLKLAAEKLRGFISDHNADVLTINQNQVSLRIAGKHVPSAKKRVDRSTDFLVDLQFEEVHIDLTREGKGVDVRTIVQVKIRPKRQRDRRNCDAIDRARLLLASAKSYLAAQDYLEAWR